MSLISTDLRPVGYDWVLYSRYTELYRDYTAVRKRFRILITENSFFQKTEFSWTLKLISLRFTTSRRTAGCHIRLKRLPNSHIGELCFEEIDFFPNFDLYTRYRADAKYFPNKYFQKSIVLAVKSSSEA